jgi:hypothetical protein
MEHGARQNGRALQTSRPDKVLMAFKEVTSAGATTPLHLHRDSDEVMYVDRFDSSRVFR